MFVGFAGEKGDALADVFAGLRNIAQIKHAVGSFVEQFAGDVDDLLGACGLHPWGVFFVEKAGDDFKGRACFANEQHGVVMRLRLFDLLIEVLNYGAVTQAFDNGAFVICGFALFERAFNGLQKFLQGDGLF